MIPFDFYARHKYCAIDVPPVRYVSIIINIAVASNTAPSAITKFIPQHMITSINATSTNIISRFISVVPPTCKMYINSSNIVRLFYFSAVKKIVIINKSFTLR